MGEHLDCWADFAAAAPRMAGDGRRLFRRGDHDQAFLVTVRGADALPRVHPISIGFVDDHLYAFLLASAKRTDLLVDGRYALHAHLDPLVPEEFCVRGHALKVTDPDVRSRVEAGWSFSPDETYDLFEFGVEHALIGVRASADDWPPRYETWPPRDR